MTVLCGVGGSQVKPGVQNFIVYSAGGAGLIGLSADWGWLEAFSVVLGLVSWDTTQLCAVDPPGFVALTAADLFNSMLPALPGNQAAVAKIAQNVNTLAWYQFCQCSTIATPAQPASPTPPANPPVVSPTLPTNARSCYGIFSEGFYDLSATGLHTGAVLGNWPANIGNFNFQFETRNDFGAPHGNILFSIKWINAGNGIVRTDNYTLDPTLAVGGPFLTVPVNGVVPPPGAVSVRTDITSAVGVKDRANNSTEGFCGTNTGPTSITPCCGPDASVIAMLQTILGQVNLIQRQAVPFAYLSSTAHAGLAGTGSFPISGLLGVSVALTTLPASLGSSVGTPVEIFDAGFVSLGSADGYPQDYRVEHNPTLILPARAGAFTTLGYTFHPGIVATITELIREP